MGWRNESFRGYADYMQTAEFESALHALGKAAAHEAVVIMCAEAVPWRCHRSLISDALTARGYRVEHIMSATKSDPHTMTSFARVEGTSVCIQPSDRRTCFNRPGLHVGTSRLARSKVRARRRRAFPRWPFPPKERARIEGCVQRRPRQPALALDPESEART